MRAPKTRTEPQAHLDRKVCRTRAPVSRVTVIVGGMADEAEFEEFVIRTEPELRRALSGHLPREAVSDALAEAFAYAWEHRNRIMRLEYPTGYLFRVAQSKARIRKQGYLPLSSVDATPNVEPGLVPALAALSPSQFHAVWLVHACGWTHGETAEALQVSASTVASRVSRALERLREQLGVVGDG